MPFPRCSFRVSLAAFFGAMVLCGSAAAQITERPYGAIRGWTVTAGFDGSVHRSCTASIQRGAQDMSMSRDDRGRWTVRVAAGGVQAARPGLVVIDDRQTPAQLDLLNGQVLFFASPGMIDDIRAGSTLQVRVPGFGETDPVPLNGTAAATARIDECFNLGGVSPSIPPQAIAGAVAPLSQGSNCPIFGTVASVNDGQLAKVTFVNQSTRALTLFWIDPTAVPQEMVRLSPGAQTRLDASTGHVWVVRGLDGACVGGLIETPASGGYIYLQ